GVAAIVAALERAAAGRAVSIYLTDGRLVPPAVATAAPLLAAASNWHALARFVCRYVSGECGLLIDIGTTTTDVIPLVAGRPAAIGQTDPERLAAGELVYTGVERTPICALATEFPWRGLPCPTAAELFATTWDIYLLLEDLPEEPASTHTADGRPATRPAALDRIARQICADRMLFSFDDALAAARAVAERQRDLIARAVQTVIARLPQSPRTIVVSGRGEFLARRVLESLRLSAAVVSLAERLDGDSPRHELSRAAPAHALAVLAREAFSSAAGAY
ncbi:MAG TPA: hydantoinase/oxoprolinase family protein, partial [Pirellulales bacterium]|nr:hydantoinase/oxoprolinase family protein [Pirellulales bacterium]